MTKLSGIIEHYKKNIWNCTINIHANKTVFLRSKYRKGSIVKIVVNRCYGGFGLSDKAVEMVMKRKGLNCFRYKQTKYDFQDGANEYTRYESFGNDDYLFINYQTVDLGEKVNELPDETYWYYYGLERDDADLVAVVEELGEEANGKFAELEVVEIPDDVKWEIDEYDGIETIHEVHRSW